MRYSFTVFLLLALPIASQAQGCKEILAKFPKHTNDSVFAKQVEDYIKGCKERPEKQPLPPF